MPKFNVGDVVVINISNIPEHSRGAYRDVFPKGGTVISIPRDGYVELRPVGKSGPYSTYNINANYFMYSGPPETVREMSYKVLSEYQNATV